MKTVTESLSSHTWLEIGGEAKIVVPEDRKELIKCITEMDEFYVLGNGSNVLATEGQMNKPVIKLSEALDMINISGNKVTVGASVELPRLVNRVVDEDLGGIEYLISVPGTVGGAIFMNAGEGAGSKNQISQYLQTVEVYKNGNIVNLNKSDCDFQNRWSVFHNHDDWVILSATLRLPSQAKSVGEKNIQQRMEKINERSRAQPNAGTIFKSGSSLPNTGLKIGGAKFVMKDRICNVDNATSKDVIRLIKLVKFLHRVVPTLDSPEEEIVVWK